MTIQIEVRGVKKVIGDLNKLSEKKLELANDLIHDAGIYIQGEVKMSISGKRSEIKSVDTGRFLNSIEVDYSQPMISKVSTDVEYAKHLEYGTSRIAPRRHFRNTLLREVPKVLDTMKKEMNKSII